MPSTVPLKRTLIISFGLLVGGGVLVAGVVLGLTLPTLTRPQQVFGMLSAVLGITLTVVVVMGSWLLDQRLVRPLNRMVSDVHRIAEGDYTHRVESLPWTELDGVRASVNELADRLVRDQDLLAANIISLDRTNRELVEARDQVIQAARLASVGTLAAGIAHEVGNPLGAVVGFTDVALSRARRSGQDTELLESIRSEADRIDAIIRTLLDYARPRELDADSISLADVGIRIRELLERQGRLDGVELVWRGWEPPGPEALVDATAVEQILLNLVLNALDAMNGSHKHRLRVELDVEDGAVKSMPIRRDGDPPGVNYMHRRRVGKDKSPEGADPLFTADNVVVLRVADGGPGVPDELRDRIFDPFYTTKDPGRGTGLGLSICARLVEGMGGAIHLEDAPEGGAEFTVRLPGVPWRDAE
ncbi:MAG: HAMP domain-containing protein [Gemmatimonadetes bacterium]|nr:HAMP domain-containing protein [Gemmatimonadota bacterium]